MARTYFEAGEQRSARVRELFATIAPRYDLINDLQSFGLHRRWKRRVIQLACPRAGRLALDVCCGTGDLAMRLAAHGATVTGVDFSARMLEVAEQRTPHGRTEAPQSLSQAQNRPRYIRADAQRLPFPNDSFDIVTAAYGLRNLADWESGLHEMHRVAKAGGRVVVLDFGKPDHALWRKLYFIYLRLFVPCLGRIFGGNAAAYAYILESLQHFPAQHGVAAKMRDLGLTNVRIVSLLGGVMAINYGEKRHDA